MNRFGTGIRTTRTSIIAMNTANAAGPRPFGAINVTWTV